jgi:hypothetical protein
MWPQYNEILTAITNGNNTNNTFTVNAKAR